ncbi:transmembrane protein 116-like [Ptychodera flava]|uniref:transmembrane protein 116-like n=1 Tax=Ptychodera flava TaxID=63121 RepID=UPI00396A8F1F
MSALFLHQMIAENGTLQLGGREAAECMDNDEEDQVKALTYIHLFVASLSILGAGSVIVYIVYWRTCRSSEVRPLFHLAIADLCLATCWVVSALVTERTMSGEMNDFCMYLQAIAEAFHLVTFFLTVNYALNVYVRTKDRQNRSNNLRPLMESAVMVWSLRLVIIFSWLLPIALMVPIVYVQVTNATDNECNTSCLLLLEWPSSTRDQESNWLWENYGMLIFVIALFLSIIALMILYGPSYRVYKQLLSQKCISIA